jgi:TonB-linked SusC/RagA family outer membrane protein
MDKLVFTLKPSIVKLENVEVSVNTGYQRIRPEQSTGSVAQITTKEYESRINTSFLDGLANKLPGLMINNNVTFNFTDASGNKNSNSLFNIRGISTMTANQSPLIVIDGYPTELTLNMIDPNEIKSVTILKDAAAATVYGVRASNGVIVIERKQASIGKPRFAFAATGSITPKENYTRYRWDPDPSSVVTNYEKDLYNLSLNAASWSQLLAKSSFSGIGYPPAYYTLAQLAANVITPYQADQSLAALKSYNNTKDYNKFFQRSAFTQTYNLDISGGSPDALYYITANYTGNQLQQIKNDNNRILLSGRSTLKFSKRFSLELTTDYQEEHSKAAPIPDITSVYPYEHFVDVNGNPASLAMGSGTNPYYNSTLMGMGLEDNLYYPLVDVNEISNKIHTVNNRIKANFDYKIGYGFDLTFGGTYETSRSDIQHLASEQSSEARQYINSYVTQNTDGTLTFNIPKGAFLRQETDNTSSYTLRGQLNYNKVIGSDHSLNAIIGGEIRDLTTDGKIASYFGYNDQTLLQQPINWSGITNQTIKGSFLSTRTIISSAAFANYFNQLYSDDRFLSGYSNIVYSFRNTYSLTASARIDQSNLFGTNPKYKYKPLWSIGAAWNINKESFMQDITWIKMLKLRVAEGFNGNVAKMSLPEVIAQSVLNPYTSPSSPALTKFSYANSSLRWEQTNHFNLGLDYAFKSIYGSIDYYRKKSTDLLGNAQIDPTIGVSPSLINNATINNTGIELNLHADWISTKNVKWNTGLVFARNTSKVLKVYQNVDYWPVALNGLGYVKDRPVGALFAYRDAGLDSAGYPMLIDKKGNLVHTEDGPNANTVFAQMKSDTSGFIKYLGSSIPTMNAGMSNQVQIGDFYVYTMISYYGGFKVAVPRPNPSDLRPLKEAGNYWKKPGDEKNTDKQALSAYNFANSNYTFDYSERYVVNGDYITLSDVTVSYSLDRTKLIKKAGFSHFEVKLQASNVWTVGLNRYDYSAATGNFAKTYTTPTYTVGIFTNF